jgi:hypothetical protein
MGVGFRYPECGRLLDLLLEAPNILILFHEQQTSFISIQNWCVPGFAFRVGVLLDCEGDIHQWVEAVQGLKTQYF